MTISGGSKRCYTFSEKETSKRLYLLPFEYFHQKIFKINPKQTSYTLPETIFFNLEESTLPHQIKNDSTGKPDIRCSIDKGQYLAKVSDLMNHIHRGDIYEINFCFDFFAVNAEIDPVLIFEKLVQKSNAPFSSLTKINDLYIICCSPERFLQKSGEKIISQPMKGTAPRHTDPKIDDQLKNELRYNPKEQNENVMIVDLVRNDLSKIAKRGSVKVDELFGVTSFATVHQMISTVSCLNNGHSIDEILAATFPMGSMTGAPKKRALELITKFEPNARGMYSGAIGIAEENGDFDLAVIIRSIVYDAKKKYLSFSVGSAITAGCDPEKEYEECLLKAQTMMSVFNQ